MLSQPGQRNVLSMPYDRVLSQVSFACAPKPGLVRDYLTCKIRDTKRTKLYGPDVPRVSPPPRRSMLNTAAVSEIVPYQASAPQVETDSGH